MLRPDEDQRPPFSDTLDADQVQRFCFSYKENHYHVCRRLFKLLGDAPGCIVTDNVWTLKTVALFGTYKKVFYLIHDYFYLQGAFAYAEVVDRFIAHAAFFLDVLLAADVNTFQDRVSYLPYGIELPAPQTAGTKNNSILHLVFLGRLTKEKGVLELLPIEEHLQHAGVPVQWTIIGQGPLKETLIRDWCGKANIRFVEAANTAAVFALLEQQDVLVFPSRFEGTPVAILEAMSRGVVPVVSDLPGGIREVVDAGAGLRCHPLKPQEFASAIACLHQRRHELKRLQAACVKKCRSHYDIANAATRYFEFFIQQSAEGERPSMRSWNIKMNFLDKPYLPNAWVYRLRNLLKKIR